MYLCGVYTQVITVQSYSHEGHQVQWLFSFHINSEVKAVLFQVLSTISRVLYIIIQISNTEHIGTTSSWNLQLGSSFKVMLP